MTIKIRILSILFALLIGVVAAWLLRYSLRRERNTRMGGGLADISDYRLVRMVFFLALGSGIVSLWLPCIWCLSMVALVVLLLDSQLTFRTIVSTMAGLGVFALWDGIVCWQWNKPMRWYQFPAEWLGYLPIAVACLALVVMYIFWPQNIRN